MSMGSLGDVIVVQETAVGGGVEGRVDGGIEGEGWEEEGREGAGWKGVGWEGEVGRG